MPIKNKEVVITKFEENIYRVIKEILGEVETE